MKSFSSIERGMIHDRLMLMKAALLLPEIIERSTNASERAMLHWLLTKVEREQESPAIHAPEAVHAMAAVLTACRKGEADIIEVTCGRTANSIDVTNLNASMRAVLAGPRETQWTFRIVERS